MAIHGEKPDMAKIRTPMATLVIFCAPVAFAGSPSEANSTP